MGENNKPRVLFLDDEPGVVGAVRRRASRHGLEIVGVARLRAAQDLLAREHYDAVVADIGVPDGSGLDLVRAALAHPRRIPAFVLTGKTADEIIRDIVNARPTNLFFKPKDLDALITALLTGGSSEPSVDLVAATGIIGGSAVATALRKLVARLAVRDEPVLVTGESGTGKELVATALHRLSGRRGACETINLTAVAPSMFEAELFGAVRGAFTGAIDDRPGPFERARGGTLFLDEIGELALEQQPKLLRVLEAKRVRRVGGSTELDVGATRLVFATNRDLQERVAAGQFRHDLRHRLDGLRIDVPPLADRREDIPELRFCEGARYCSPAGCTRVACDAVVPGQRPRATERGRAHRRRRRVRRRDSRTASDAEPSTRRGTNRPRTDARVAKLDGQDRAATRERQPDAGRAGARGLSIHGAAMGRVSRAIVAVPAACAARYDSAYALRRRARNLAARIAGGLR